MRTLSKEEANHFLNKTIKIARKATCERSSCGAIIVKNNRIIGAGINSPPGDLESQRRCHIKKKEYDVKVTDKTCCVHAEQRAMFDALKRHPDKISGSTLYFARLKEGRISFAKNPYCTICSKIALDLGIKEFVLFHEKDAIAYDTEEYNDLSYNFNK